MLDDYEDDGPVDPQLIRADQLQKLTDEYARLWRANADLHRIHEVERLLERLLTLHEPVEIPNWLLPGSDRSPPKTVLPDKNMAAQVVRIFRELHTCVNLIDPALKERDWSDELVRREESFRDYRDGRLKRPDYTLWLPRRHGRRRLIAFIEAKHDGHTPERGLEQAKAYAAGRRERMPVVFSTNGYHYVQFNCRTKNQCGPCPLNLFPKPDELAELLH